MEAEEAVGFFVGLQDKTEIAGGGGAGWQVDGDRMGRGIGCLGTGIEKGIKGGVEEGVASGGLVVELLPGGGGELVLALDGEQDLLLAVELEVVLEIGEGGGYPGADGALGDAELSGDGRGTETMTVESEGLLAQGDGMGDVGRVGEVCDVDVG